MMRGNCLFSIWQITKIRTKFISFNVYKLVMIEFIVLGILVLFFVSLLFFVKSSFIVIAVNALVALFIILMIEIDLRNKKMHKPYMVGVAITITFLV